eukprot:jgi/Botrbrau1/8908/Bobra.0148s0023.1
MAPVSSRDTAQFELMGGEAGERPEEHMKPWTRDCSAARDEYIALKQKVKDMRIEHRNAAALKETGRKVNPCTCMHAPLSRVQTATGVGWALIDIAYSKAAAWIPSTIYKSASERLSVHGHRYVRQQKRYISWVCTGVTNVCPCTDNLSLAHSVDMCSGHVTTVINLWNQMKKKKYQKRHR